jgi:hypothetical protein
VRLVAHKRPRAYHRPAAAGTPSALTTDRPLRAALPLAPWNLPTRTQDLAESYNVESVPAFVFIPPVWGPRAVRACLRADGPNVLLLLSERRSPRVPALPRDG